jgi:hypothetical protein
MQSPPVIDVDAPPLNPRRLSHEVANFLLSERLFDLTI